MNILSPSQKIVLEALNAPRPRPVMVVADLDDIRECGVIAYVGGRLRRISETVMELMFLGIVSMSQDGELKIERSGGCRPECLSEGKYSLPPVGMLVAADFNVGKVVNSKSLLVVRIGKRTYLDENGRPFRGRIKRWFEYPSSMV